MQITPMTGWELMLSDTFFWYSPLLFHFITKFQPSRYQTRNMKTAQCKQEFTGHVTHSLLSGNSRAIEFQPYQRFSDREIGWRLEAGWGLTLAKRERGREAVSMVEWLVVGERKGRHPHPLAPTHGECKQQSSIGRPTHGGQNLPGSS